MGTARLEGPRRSKPGLALQLRKQKGSGTRWLASWEACTWTQIPEDGTSHSPFTEEQGKRSQGP